MMFYENSRGGGRSEVVCVCVNDHAGFDSQLGNWYVQQAENETRELLCT